LKPDIRDTEVQGVSTPGISYDIFNLFVHVQADSVRTSRTGFKPAFWGRKKWVVCELIAENSPANLVKLRHCPVRSAVRRWKWTENGAASVPEVRKSPANLVFPLQSRLRGKLGKLLAFGRPSE
jgi:hypothetical protein